MRIFK
jgi:hypothetical protein